MANKPEWYEARTEIARFALPLLKDLHIKGRGYPASFEIEDEDMESNFKYLMSRTAWEKELYYMIQALELIAYEDPGDPDYQGAIDRGLASFSRYFLHLWD